MYIAINNEEFVPRHFVVCDFYNVETCFCWDAEKLVICPYTTDGSTGETHVVPTPAPVKKVQFFDSRAFLICSPHGAYKVSRTGEFAILSKNALSMGSEFFQVLTVWNNGVYFDNKQVKSSTPLFPLAPNTSETVCTFPLNPTSTEPQLIRHFAAGWETTGNLCVMAHHRKLYVLKSDTVQLVYTSDCAIVDILPAKRQDKVAGLLLLTEHANIVILVHDGDDKDTNNYGLVFERIYLGESMKDCIALCAGFSLRMKNILWIVCCNQFRMHYIKKELFVEAVQEAKVEERTFICMQYYKPNVILGLLRRKELVELSLEKLDDSLLNGDNIVLHTGMFQRTDIIMEKICAKGQELNALYENLSYEQDKLKRINMYAAKQRLLINPHIEVSRVSKHCYLGLSIPDKLPENSYVMFTFASKNQNTFCLKRVTESCAVAIKMPINENQMLCSSSVSMDLITLMNEQRPWCLIQNFINSSSQEVKRKRGTKKDKTVFINAKIASLKQLITEKKLNMTKLCEIKRIVRTEL